MRRRHLAAALPALALALASCAQTQGDDDTGTVVVSAYPMQFLAERVTGGEVTSVAAPGVEPHDLELSSRAVATLAGADAVLYLGGFQAAVDDAIGQASADTLIIDAAASADLLGEDGGHEEHEQGDHEHEEEHEQGDHEHEEEHEEEHAHADHDHGGVDPHFWLDPMRMADVADDLAEQLAQRHPDDASAYRANASALREELETLDGDMADTLAGCADATFVTSHEAFGYLAHRYDLHQVGVAGLDPEAESSPAQIATALEAAREADVSTIFAQPGDLATGAQAVADELGLTLTTLDPLELEPQDGDYLTGMRENITALREGLACAA